MIDASKKLAGLLIPAFALRRTGDLGIGDTTAVKAAIDFCSRHNATVLQLLPINETGGDNSPYNTISSVALDPVLLDVSPNMVPGLTEQRFNEIASPALLSSLRQGEVKYAQVKQLKLALLQAAFDGFEQSQAGFANAAQAFNQFKQAEHSWLDSYTLFRTLIWLNNGNTCWSSWKEEQRCPEKALVFLKQQANFPELTRKREFFAFVQWVAFSQWQAVGQHATTKAVRLMGDIPFGISRYSADVWAHGELFDLTWSCGAPPEQCFQDDPFSAKHGQNWGLPLYLWDRHKATDFAWWRQRVKQVTRTFSCFRIDHVLGFFRTYAFPWLPERNPEFLDLTEAVMKQKTSGRAPQFFPRSDYLSQDARANAADGRALLEMILAAAGDAWVVAEDLGATVPDYVRPLLTELGIAGFTIPQWEHSDNYEIKRKEMLRPLSLATYATHDHLPLVLFYEDLVAKWHGANGHSAWLEMQRLMRFLGLDDSNPPIKYTDELHEVFLKTLFNTPCWLAVLMITELLSSCERFNQPGTSGGSNWSRRLDHDLDWYEQNPPFNRRIALFLNW